MSIYSELQSNLRRKGIGSYLQNPDQLVVSNQNPAWPDSNCFWVTRRKKIWYVGTWSPAVYEVPLNVDISEVCDAVFHSSTRAIFTVEPALVDQWRLRRLTEEENEQLGFA